MRGLWARHWQCQPRIAWSATEYPSALRPEKSASRWLRWWQPLLSCVGKTSLIYFKKKEREDERLSVEVSKGKGDGGSRGRAGGGRISKGKEEEMCGWRRAHGRARYEPEDEVSVSV